MEIFLKHLDQTNNSTIGDLTIDGEHQIYMIENGYRNPKVMNESRIPVGRYKLILNTTCEHHFKYLKMFPDFHRGMIEVSNVPNFHEILQHIGNYAFLGRFDSDGKPNGDTHGCQLTCKSYFRNTTTDCFQGRNSTDAYIPYYKKIIALMNTDEVWLNIS
jgi:hypothetical protein